MTTDASSVGVAGVISHMTDQGERPIAYGSRSLTKAERAYSQIEREALAIIYGVKKFHQYLYGRKFTLKTDHKPLTTIFGSKAGIPIMAASRMQRWAVVLSGYNYDIEYVPSKKNSADALSRLPPINTANKSDKGRVEVTYVNFVENFLPVNHAQVRKYTSSDLILSKILIYVQSGWPMACTEDELKPFFIRRNELYADLNCIMWGYRMVIPTALREAILRQLHSSHLGIVKTKAHARSYVWWPNIDADIEKMGRECETCAKEMPAPTRAPPQPWPYIAHVWSRLHIDFLGPFNGKIYVVVVDSSSKWLEIAEMHRTNAAVVVKVMRSLFARFGLPLEVVSDQGPPFTSAEFGNFLQNNGIRQSFSPAYHPASNGAAENAVKTCKRAIKKALSDQVDVDAALQTFLLAYRNTAHSTTGESPAMLLQKRPLRSRMDLLRADRAVLDRVHEAQKRQVEYSGGKSRNFTTGEPIWSRDYRNQSKWDPNTIVVGEGSRRYIVADGNGRQTVKHVDQIRRRSRMSDVPLPGGGEFVAGTLRGNECTTESQQQRALESNSPTKVKDQSQGVTSPRVVDEDVFQTPSPSGSATPYTPPKVSSQPPPPTASPQIVPPEGRPKRTRKPVIRFQCQ